MSAQSAGRDLISGSLIPNEKTDRYAPLRTGQGVSIGFAFIKNMITTSSHAIFIKKCSSEGGMGGAVCQWQTLPQGNSTKPTAAETDRKAPR